MADIQGTILLLLLPFLIWLIPAILFRVLVRNHSRLIPPSPPALPIIGHLHLLSPTSHQDFHRLSKRYGPLMYLRLGSVPCVVASSPEIAKEFLKTHEDSFSNRPKFSVVDYITYGSQDFTFAPYGPYWKFMKKVCMSELFSGKTLDLLSPVRRDEIKGFMELLSRKAEASESVDVGSELSMLTHNIMCRMTLSKRCCENETEAGDIKKFLQEISEIRSEFNVSDFIWLCKKLDFKGVTKRVRDVKERFDEVIEKIIGEHEEARKMKQMKMETEVEEEEVKDLLDILLNISEDQSSNLKLSRENIKAFILNIFIAGIDTTAHSIRWALSELMNHPKIMEKAREEIDLVVGNERLVDELDAPNLPYLKAIIKETLRLHPQGPLIRRESTQHCEIRGYRIPANTRLYINVWAIGRDPGSWEDPLEFRPERFLCEAEETVGNGIGIGSPDVRGQHFHFLPFGSGRRGCPGISLTLRVVQASLAAMIQCFEWKISPNGGGTGINTHSNHDDPLLCLPVPRHTALPF